MFVGSLRSMAAGSPDSFPKHLQTLFSSGAIGGLDDGALLDRFVASRDEAAFEILVARHGPMVLRVCRAALADPNEADDAFQAVFLVLVRKAAAIRSRASVASWLFGVASRVSARAKVDAARRCKHEQQVAQRSPVTAAELIEEPLEWTDVLHEELARLPARYREALVLCYFEGHTCDDAAAWLRRPVGTVKARLSRARGIMKQRLLRRGVTLPAGMLVAGATVEGATVPQELVSTTVSSASRLVAGVTASAASARILLLAEGAITSMLMQKIKLVATVVLSVVLAAGTVLVAWGASYPGDKRPAKAEVKAGGTAAGESPVAVPVSGRAAPDAGTPEEVFSRAIAALDQDRIDDFVAAMHPEAVKQLRTTLMGTIESLAGQGESDQVFPMFPGVKTLGDLKKLDDRRFVARYLGELFRGQPVFKLTLAKTMGEVLGHVDEDKENVYVVYRSTVDDRGENPGQLKAIRLRKDGQRWALQIPEVIEKFVESTNRTFGGNLHVIPELKALKTASRFEPVGRLLSDGDTAHVVLREITPLGAFLRVLTVKKSEPGWVEALAGKPEGLAKLVKATLHLAGSSDGAPRVVPPPVTTSAPADRAPEGKPVAAAERPLAYVENQPRSKAIRAKLEMPIALKYPNETPLERVLSDLARATQGPNDTGIPIYVDPVGLNEAEKTMTSPVVIDVEGVPLKNTLPRLLAPLGLAYCVCDGLVIISNIEDIDERFKSEPLIARDKWPGTSAMLTKLERPIAMKYPGLTPLERVLADIVKATKGPNDSGIRIYVDLAGMTEAEETMTSPITIDLEGIPLRTTLRLLLWQLGLDYSVHDGLLIIGEFDDIDWELENAPVLAFDRSPGTLSILTRLAQPIAMKYPNETPLEQVVADIAKATRGANDAGIRIEVDPTGLEAAGKMMTSPIRIAGLEDIPLRTTLRLVLKQLELGYFVENGRLTITDKESLVHARAAHEYKKPVLTADKSLKTLAVLIKLEQPNALMNYPQEVPLRQVISDIAKPTRVPNASSIPVHVDPTGLKVAGKTMTSPVWMSDASAPMAPLRITLRRVLDVLGLDYYVRDGLLIISEAEVIDKELKKAQVIARNTSPETKMILTRLEQPISMRYPNETPLERVVADITKATKGPNDSGIPIHVDPAGLKVAGKTMTSPVTIDLEGIPLRTTLRLVLEQLGLDYYVDDGRLMINDEVSVEAERAAAARGR
jgi:RNA polymerase sigma factor (sigma-70 family)